MDNDIYENEEKIYFEELMKIIKKLRDNKKKNFDRVLPINELLSDRWEKAEYLKFGKQTSVYDSSVVKLLSTTSSFHVFKRLAIL